MSSCAWAGRGAEQVEGRLWRDVAGKAGKGTGLGRVGAVVPS
jgi:hypothetical protein